VPDLFVSGSAAQVAAAAAAAKAPSAVPVAAEAATQTQPDPALDFDLEEELQSDVPAWVEAWSDAKLNIAILAVLLSALTLIGLFACSFYFGFVFWLEDMPRGGNLGGLLVAAPVFSLAVAALGLLIGSYLDQADRAMEVLVPTSVVLFFLTPGLPDTRPPTSCRLWIDKWLL